MSWPKIILIILEDAYQKIWIDCIFVKFMYENRLSHTKVVPNIAIILDASNIKFENTFGSRLE